MGLEAPAKAFRTDRAASQQPARQTTIDALPDVLLGRVLAANGRRQGRNIPLVCKRWQLVFYSQPELWTSLEIRTPSIDFEYDHRNVHSWFSATHALLQRCGHLVQALRVPAANSIQTAGVESRWAWQMADLLRCLPPPAAAAAPRSGAGAADSCSSSSGGRLACLELDFQPTQLGEMPAGVLPWLQRQAGLTQLNLSAYTLPPSMPGALRQLQQLLNLQIRLGEQLPGGLLCGAVVHLRQLTRLHLHANVLPAAMCQLTCLQGLQDLALFETQGGTAVDVVVPSPVAFPLLTTCIYSSAAGWVQVAGTVCRLRVVSVWHAASGASASSTCPAPLKATLELTGVSDMGPLSPLLASLLPAHVPLRALYLSDVVLAPAALQDCPRLGTLTRLALSHCQGFADSGIGAPLDALLEQAPRLASLILNACMDEDDDGELPTCLLASRGLTQIRLPNNHLVSLPEGPYLGTCLESLDLSNNIIDVVPPALAAATGLTSLDLSENSDLELTSDGVAGVLAHLPRLQQLSLDGTYASLSALMELARALPRLTVGLTGSGDVIRLTGI